MHKTLTPLLLVLALTPANAAGISYKLPTTLGNIAPIYMPGVSIIPMTLPTVDAVIAVPVIKPTLNVTVVPVASPFAAPVAAPISLPVLPAAAIGQALLPGVPSPLPLPERATLSALEQLLNPALGVEKRGLTADNPFDGRRKKRRELEVPRNRYL